ncbi:hypothetical protein O1611_g5246 [Lasiodiplodia mahajangana]|uniref:Uncharacterized protein n=1 Tax=Lasiodiplodia mahajangana TaxID=1108764 RepID=A0ACC2JLZ2_9PEZI|nr:hypothetical protein O1611_g5246 [Lasiodiplodia mahajangana]
MDDTAQDPDYSLPQEYPDGTFDLFPGVNFNDTVDADFEARLEEDFPIEEDPNPPSPAAPSPYALEPSNEQPSFDLDSLPDFSSDANLQHPQFIDPTLVFNNGQPSYPPLNNNATDDLNIDWSALIPPSSINNMIMNDPIFTSHPLPTQIYPQNTPMDAQFNGQQVVQQPMFVPQQPMGMPFVNGQQIVQQQPMNQGYQGYQVGWQPQQLPIQHPMAQAIPQPVAPQIPEPTTQFMTQSVQQPGIRRKSSGGVELINDSDLPMPLDRKRYSRQPPSPGT